MKERPIIFSIVTGKPSCEKPIIFSAQMVRAILDGRKTMTRRVIKWDRIPSGFYLAEPDCQLAQNPCSYGQPGERLWVRETWKPTRSGAAIPNGTEGPGTYIRYTADDSRREVKHDLQCRGADKESWRPSIFMPRWASRITLEITAVRVERLQDMSNEDAEREGFRWCNAADPVDMFMCLWNRLNAKRGYGWDANPWVWVITFKTLKEKP